MVRKCIKREKRKREKDKKKSNRITKKDMRIKGNTRGEGKGQGNILKSGKERKNGETWKILRIREEMTEGREEKVRKYL